MKFTGERFIVGQAVDDITIEHLQRYKSITHIVKGKKVLDAACGEGYGSNILSQYATSVTGIDISNEAVTYAKEHYKRDNLKYICASIENIPLEDHSIDVIVSFETIEHVNADLQEKFLQEIKRVLKPDGILIMSSPDKRTYSDLRNYNNIYHVHELYKNEFEELLKKHFRYIKLFSQGICNQRIGIIREEENSTLQFLSNIDIYNEELLYFIAICSMKEMNTRFITKFNTIMFYKERFPAKIFIDTGKGFSEKDTIFANMQYEGKQYVAYFNFSDVKNIHGLRFDPIEYVGGSFKILEISSNIEGLTIKSINSIKEDNENEYFMTVDPQYKIEGNFENLEWIKIKYKLEIITSEKIANYLEQECRKKEADIILNKNKIYCLEQELNHIKASKVYRLYENINRIKNKIKI